MRNGLASIAVVILVATAWFQIDDNPIHLPLIFSQAEASTAEELYKGYIMMCKTTHEYTKIVVGGVNEQIVYSDSPDGPILPDGNSERWAVEISKMPVEGNWWVWLVDSEGKRVSESLPVHTDSELGLYKCQQVTVVFYRESEIAP